MQILGIHCTWFVYIVQAHANDEVSFPLV